MDEKDTYHDLLGFEWDNDNEATINLKRMEMPFKVEGMRVFNLMIQLRNKSMWGWWMIVEFPTI